MNLVQEANLRGALYPGFYAEIERTFDTSYLGMLLVRGLADDLPEFVRKNPVMVESDEDTIICHINPVKLMLYPGGRFGVQVMTHDDKKKHGLMVDIWYNGNTNNDLTIGFHSVDHYGRENMFGVRLPNTLDHKLSLMLGQLRDIVLAGVDDLPARLQAWEFK